VELEEGRNYLSLFKEIDQHRQSTIDAILDKHPGFDLYRIFLLLFCIPGLKMESRHWFQSLRTSTVRKWSIKTTFFGM
jgi:hypothetical protein